MKVSLCDKCGGDGRNHAYSCVVIKIRTAIDGTRSVHGGIPFQTCHYCRWGLYQAVEDWARERLREPAGKAGVGNPDVVCDRCRSGNEVRNTSICFCEEGYHDDIPAEAIDLCAACRADVIDRIGMWIAIRLDSPNCSEGPGMFVPRRSGILAKWFGTGKRKVNYVPMGVGRMKMSSAVPVMMSGYK